MKFKEKASSIALAAILMAASIAPVNAYMKEEIVGSNRYETAAKVADRMRNYSSAILVNGNSIADGLSASGLAGKENAPILLVKKDSIPKETLQRLYKVKKVYIIGKENAVSSRVENSLNQAGMSVKRIGGSNRIDTSIAVSKEIGSYSKAFLVNGFKGEADAMSVSSIAARDKATIILTNGNSNPVSKKSGVKYYVIGGNTVMSNSLQSSFGAERLSGSNRYTTNKVIVEKFYPNTDKLYFAKGDGLVDALAVSPLAKNSGLALVSENSDKSVFYDKGSVVQVGGMSSSIVDKVVNATMGETPNPDDPQKPDENKPNPDDQQKPPVEDQKPSEQTYDINSPEFQKIVRDEFYRLLDDYRAGKPNMNIKHHWACEESALIKSKDMINKDYYDHAGGLSYPHIISKAECIHWIYVYGDITENKAKEIANKLFNDWKNSTDHRDIMLSEVSDHIPYNGDFAIDGFAFYSKWNPSADRYDLKATYHRTDSGCLWDTPDTTNPYSPGYKPKLSSIPEENIKNITKIFR